MTIMSIIMIIMSVIMIIIIIIIIISFIIIISCRAVRQVLGWSFIFLLFCKYWMNCKWNFCVILKYDYCYYYYYCYYRYIMSCKTGA